VLGSATQLNGRSRVKSMHSPVPLPDVGEADFREMFESEPEDPSCLAARKLDWAAFLATVEDWIRAILLCVAEGGSLRSVAICWGVSESMMQSYKRKLAAATRNAMAHSCALRYRPVSWLRYFVFEFTLLLPASPCHEHLRPGLLAALRVDCSPYSAFLAPAWAADKNSAPRKKFIELGWDIPSTSLLRERWSEMEQNTPFDGVMFKVETKDVQGRKLSSEGSRTLTGSRIPLEHVKRIIRGRCGQAYPSKWRGQAQKQQAGQHEGLSIRPRSWSGRATDGGSLSEGDRAPTGRWLLTGEKAQPTARGRRPAGKWPDGVAVAVAPRRGGPALQFAGHRTRVIRIEGPPRASLPTSHSETAPPANALFPMKVQLVRLQLAAPPPLRVDTFPIRVQLMSVALCAPPPSSKPVLFCRTQFFMVPLITPAAPSKAELPTMTQLETTALEIDM